jgi:hypothetical protein
MGRTRNWILHFRLPILITVALSVAGIVSGQRFDIEWSTFLAIFIPASVGVLGSYWLYEKRKWDNSRRLRKALLSELEGMVWFDSWPGEVGRVPPFDPVKSTVYDQNAASLGDLSDKEITHIVEFYTRAKVVGDLIDIQRDLVVATTSSMFKSQTQSFDTDDAVLKTLDRLALSHQRAIYTLKQHLEGGMDGYSRVTEGDKITEKHPILRELEILAQEYGLIESVGTDTYRVTPQGEMFFEGELNAIELEKEITLVNRNVSKLEKISTIFQSILNRSLN